MSQANRDRGRLGEEQVRRSLAAESPADWFVLHGRRVPQSRCDVDHIACGPPGVFIIDTKSWRSRVRVHGDAVWGAAGRIDLEPLRFATSSVRRLLGVSPTPVACFVGQRVSGVARDVEVTGLADLVTLLVQRPLIFEPEVVRAFHDVLRRTLPPVGWQLRKRQRARTGKVIVDEGGRQLAVWTEDGTLTDYCLEDEADALALVREAGEQQRLGLNSKA